MLCILTRDAFPAPLSLNRLGEIFFLTVKALNGALDKVANDYSFRDNLCWKTFLGRYCHDDTGASRSLGKDPELGNYEWRRKMERSWGEFMDVLCCPEDCFASPECQHEKMKLCLKCSIPVCEDCWSRLQHPTRWRIPWALCNDNFKGYAHEFLVRNEVRWIEAVTACPHFSVIMTYYVEGQKGHMMEEEISAPKRAYATRGNLFSFALDWDDILKFMERRTTEEQLTMWPHAPDVVAQWVRVVLKKGDVDMMKHIKQLYVRAHVVHGLARLYLERHLSDLEGNPGARQLKERLRALEDRLADRMNAIYPAAVYNNEEGALSDALRQRVEESLARWKTRAAPTPGIELKNQTMADAPRDINELFEDVRPVGVMAERDSSVLTEYSDQVKMALQKHSNLDVQVGTKFEDQFVGPYLSKIFPWALNYETGGPEYPDFSLRIRTMKTSITLELSSMDAIADPTTQLF